AHPYLITIRRSFDRGFESVFPNATIYMTEIEWKEVQNHNVRTKGTYLKENWEPIQEQVKVFKDRIEIIPGIEMFHTGGHSNGLRSEEHTSELQSRFE